MSYLVYEEPDDGYISEAEETQEVLGSFSSHFLGKNKNLLKCSNHVNFSYVHHTDELTEIVAHIPAGDNSSSGESLDSVNLSSGAENSNGANASSGSGNVSSSGTYRSESITCKILVTDRV